MDRLDDRLLFIGKIDADDSPIGAGHLVHQARRLAEVCVLTELADDGQVDRRKGIVVVQVIENGTAQHLYGC
ncbi:hypothetical protein SDC9_85570 [bioreactor metagenome]|uniref:Uncharacterized protein n=1 Tax=bioreactor metagenome TaxID=1076179 RepID=A0A644ZDW2_9ZZZZ